MILCREMQEDDISKIAKLEKENFSRPWSKTSLQKEIKNRDSIFIIAEYKDDIAGYAGMYLIGTEGDITNVVVSHLYRRKGVASAIIECVTDYAKKIGITEITLEVRKSNIAAVNLYEKFGFISEGIRPGFYDLPKEDAIIMWLRNI